MNRYILAILVVAFSSAVQAQTYLPGSFIDYNYRINPAHNIRFGDSTSQKKWSLTKYSGISTSFSFFKGGSATIVSAPIGMQLNRKLSNNVYAFAGVSVAPSYVNFRSSFMNADLSKMNGNNPFNSASLGLYSRAELGLMYVNDEKTFSISGSIGIERSTYPSTGYLPMSTLPQNQPVSVKK